MTEGDRAGEGAVLVRSVAVAVARRRGVADAEGDGLDLDLDLERGGGFEGDRQRKALAFDEAVLEADQHNVDAARAQCRFLAGGHVDRLDLAHPHHAFGVDVVGVQLDPGRDRARDLKDALGAGAFVGDGEIGGPVLLLWRSGAGPGAIDHEIVVAIGFGEGGAGETEEGEGGEEAGGHGDRVISLDKPAQEWYNHTNKEVSKARKPLMYHAVIRGFLF